MVKDNEEGKLIDAPATCHAFSTGHIDTFDSVPYTWSAH
jgi:hypothetical protein